MGAARTLGREVLCIVSSCGLLGGAAFGQDPIFEVDDDPLTSYLLDDTSTLVHEVRPRAIQRGTGIDGTLRAPTTLGAALSASPFGSVWTRGQSLNGVRLDTGAYAPTEVDIALPTTGAGWTIARSYNPRQEDDSSSHHVSQGPQGANWFQSSQPEIYLYDDDQDAADDRVYLFYGADRFLEYKRDSSSSDEFKSKNGAGGVFQYETGAGSEPDTYTLTDYLGNEVVFFGFDTDSGNGKGQIWKLKDAKGGVAYVGDATTGSTAISSGYNSDGHIKVAYDSASNDGRRYTYTYTAVGSAGNKLTKVLVETKSGGTWASPTGLTEVAEVVYAYYVDADSYGEDGDLKLVTVTTPLTDSGVELVRKRYFRYWEGTYDASTNPGHEHEVKLVLDYEGTRNYDWLDDTFDEDFLTASHASLEPYASAYFEYDSNRRIREAFFNGECGCSGGADGAHEFEYETNTEYSDGAGYDTEWATRTIVKRPDNSYVTYYFDEVGQPLHQVVTDADPDNTSPAPETWVTKVTRDSDGQVTDIHSPANVTSYTHSNDSNWAISTSTTVGLVETFVRVSSGDLEGLLTDRKHKTGTSGSAYLDETISYTTNTSTLGDVVVTRPLVDDRRVYSEEITSGTTGSYLTQYSYTNYSGLDLTIEKITTTHPAVSTGNNGSGSSETRSVHLSKDGRVDFEKSEDGVITYREYTDGRVTKLIEDADTSKTGSGEDFENVTVPTGFSSSGSPLHRVTKHSFDALGRSDETTLPGGRVIKRYYSNLADERRVTLQYADYETTPSTKFYGPVQYRVTNHAGKAEVDATVALSGNETSSALTAHIDETDDDPITAADLGTVAKLTTSLYSESGGTLEDERLYHLVPASGAGTDGTNYDPTLYGYDDSGRRTRVKHAHGTIYRTEYDIHGRTTERWIGQNDSSFDGGEASGTDNMVKTEALVYDSDGDGGNGHLTKRTLYVEDGTTDQRVTEYEHDVRGRVLLAKNPTAPHVFDKYDNLGRKIASASYSSYSSIDVDTDDPTTEATNRLALSRTFYDEMGRVWKSQRHKIDQNDGSDDDNLQTLNWYDAAGRQIKTKGSTFAKTSYDRLGRQTHRYMLGYVDDTGYADADDVSGDIVMEEHQTVYDPDDGDVIMTAVIERFHDDWGATPTTGPLDTNADSDELKYTAANLEGRIQITANWYDRFGRMQDRVLYGTYGGSDFDRDGLSVPTRSDTALRTTNTYATDGQLQEVEDPRGLVMRYEYDAAGRKTKEIRNYDAGVNSGNPSGTDDNVTTAYTYTDGLMTALTADLPSGATDQTTTYTHGTTKGAGAGDSKIATGHLRSIAQYPDSSGGTDVVTFAYNAQGQEIYKKDQAGNVLESDYDTSGRRSHYRITTVATGFDATVRRVSTTYDSLGRRSLVTQYDNATVGSGTVLDEVKFTYEDWGNVSNFEQDRNSAVGASGSVDDYEVSYTYVKATGGRNAIRIVNITHPSGQVITCRYRGGVGDRHDDFLSRVTHLDPPTALVVYAYNGMGRVVGTDYWEPDVRSNVYGSTSGTYPDLDRFNRITTNRWTAYSGTETDFYDIDLAYDRGSNITVIEDNVHTGFDVEYSIDDIDRVTQAEEGTWSGSAITSKTRDQQWTLDHVGNWDQDRLDLDGDGNFTGTGEHDDDRTHNDVNELTGRDIDDSGTDDYTLSYDAVGNLIDDGENYEYVWDPLGRLRKILDRSDDSLVAEYRYNGLNHRISVHEDTDDDGDVDSNDKWFHHAYNPRWQLLATFREDDTDPKEEFVYNLAGLDGHGSSSYIDDVLFRDKDANTAWTSASDGTLEETIYYCQNWRADVSVLVTSDGVLVEWDKYSAYGVPIGLPSGDTDSDGDCDSTDLAQVQAWITSGYDVRGDINLDGDVTAADESLLQTGTTLGRGALSAVGNRAGYSGYRTRDTLGLAFVRHRVLALELGRWTRRDPLGYVDGPNTYSYAVGNPPIAADPQGTVAVGLNPSDCPPVFLAPNGQERQCWGQSFRLGIRYQLYVELPGSCEGPLPCAWAVGFKVKIEQLYSDGWRATEDDLYDEWHEAEYTPGERPEQTEWPAWSTDTTSANNPSPQDPPGPPATGWSASTHLYTVVTVPCTGLLVWTWTVESYAPIDDSGEKCVVSASMYFYCGGCNAATRCGGPGGCQGPVNHFGSETP